RALETHCEEVLVGKSGVDGVYTADSRTEPTAVRIDHLTFEEAIGRDLRVVDSIALALCRDNHLTMRVIGIGTPCNVAAAPRGAEIVTIVTSEPVPQPSKEQASSTTPFSKPRRRWTRPSRWPERTSPESAPDVPTPACSRRSRWTTTVLPPRCSS